MEMRLNCLQCGDCKAKKEFKDQVLYCNDCNKKYLQDIKHCWEEYGDIEMFCDFSIDRLRKADWRIANSYVEYTKSLENLDFNIKNYEKNIPPIHR